jgi:hypothetical protein
MLEKPYITAFAANGKSITAAMANNTITARFPGRNFIIFSFRSGKAGEQFLAIKGFICSIRFIKKTGLPF